MAVPILDEELIATICGLIAKGLSKKAAASGACISTSSFYSWLERGKQEKEAGEETIYTVFLDRVKKAEAAFKLKHLQNIEKAAEEGNWQASAWALERCYYDEFGRKTVSMEVSGKDGNPIQTENTVKIYIPDNSR